MVVRDQHRVELRQVGQRHRHRVVAPRADAARRRDPVAPDRVGEHPVALELEQHGRVAEPGRGELTGLLPAGSGSRAGPVRAACPCRPLVANSAAMPAVLALRCLGRGQPVVEQPVVELRRVAVVELRMPAPMERRTPRAAVNSEGSTAAAARLTRNSGSRGRGTTPVLARDARPRWWSSSERQRAISRDPISRDYRTRTTNRLHRAAATVDEQLTTTRRGHHPELHAVPVQPHAMRPASRSGRTAPMVRCHRPLCRTTVRSTFPTWEAVTSTAPAPSRTWLPGDAVLARRHLRHHADPVATEVGRDAELVVHDRPEDPVGAPRLERHRPLGEQLLDVAAEVGRRRDLRHRAGQLPHLRVELHSRVAGRVVAQLARTHPSECRLRRGHDRGVQREHRAQCGFADVAESHEAPRVAVRRPRSGPVPVWNSPNVARVAGLFALLDECAGMGERRERSVGSTRSLQLHLGRRDADPVALEDLVRCPGRRASRRTAGCSAPFHQVLSKRRSRSRPCPWPTAASRCRPCWPRGRRGRAVRGSCRRCCRASPRPCRSRSTLPSPSGQPSSSASSSR